jgi:hypothetical protein
MPNPELADYRIDETAREAAAVTKVSFLGVLMTCCSAPQSTPTKMHLTASGIVAGHEACNMRS